MTPQSADSLQHSNCSIPIHLDSLDPPYTPSLFQTNTLTRKKWLSGHSPFSHVWPYDIFKIMTILYSLYSFHVDEYLLNVFAIFGIFIFFIFIFIQTRNSDVHLYIPSFLGQISIFFVALVFSSTFLSTFNLKKRMKNKELSSKVFSRTTHIFMTNSVGKSLCFYCEKHCLNTTFYRLIESSIINNLFLKNQSLKLVIIKTSCLLTIF